MSTTLDQATYSLLSAVFYAAGAKHLSGEYEGSTLELNGIALCQADGEYWLVNL